MLYSEKTIVLKDGRQALLRSARVDDARAMLDFLKTITGETEFLLRYPEECSDDTEAEERYLSDISQSDSQLMILCEVDGKIAGNCHLTFNAILKTRHRATVAIALLRQFWGLGIGTAMFEEMILLAKEKDLDHLKLDYIEGNDRARGLYEKMGFYQVAEVPDSYRMKDGSIRKSILMLKKL